MSTDVGRLFRLKRIFRNDGKCLVVAMDHGFVMGPLAGIIDPGPAIRAVIKGGADAVMTTLGIAERYGDLIAGKSSFIFSSPAVQDMAPTVDLALKFRGGAPRLFH